MSRPFVFCDRDGTLVEDRGYVHRIDDYCLLPGVVGGLQSLQDAGYGLAIVTNQSGIARGYYTEADFERFQAHLTSDLDRQGIQIAASYHCPHLPNAGCACRKPGVALLERAQRELDCDLAASWVVGDSPSDVALAERAGCRSVFLLTGQGAGRRAEVAAGVLVADNLRAAADAIIHVAK
jgi:D-glycero-D-manno-heptose 1,7-bisphosphate phosphatase